MTGVALGRQISGMEVNESKFSIAGFIDPEGNYIGLSKPDQG